ncbi:MAG: UDP-N-acetylmuramoyl-tripeptide--D-alanyl-D-alanine ligase [Xanthomonadales bacterium]|nr:UDP-N-acetylmuramoyl-tripeptide--D-alanyl-D-alanine ligase [Gammaproteobacteria bacterium]MBT8052591.1 UDP-N-acetylmuramoyl-tripeptide--D-alanyl-D-alanine ligase [Gammaproteobacteria bacterium]NND56650.1 UDP-N-acetylmuramoyl-tripeptide--D-alanyl-D-alanine ligase [Xanthomonadales bacterium]NNK52408.1 UDP-N-acetylmuramoyl-tripeptide--D-alanyl-D-alanine ligase [Xanthomonadales bacterium]
MIPLLLSELAEALNCPAPAADVSIDNIVTDSRSVHHGTLFAALPGSNVDGHDFAFSAVKLGAPALLVSRSLSLEIPQLVVEDVLLALGILANLLRTRLDPVVVGITGSNGKTTVKEMVAAILRLEADVLATQGNYNNELGVPLSLFGLEARHRFAVIEMGAAKAGDIAYLASIAKPDLGLITNIGPAHLGGFGSEEGVARTKGEMYAALPAEGTAVFNADEPWLGLWKEMSCAERCVTFGIQPGADVRLVEQGSGPSIVTPEGTIRPRLLLPGSHNLINAAAATAVALSIGIDLETTQRGLESVKPVPGRLNRIQTEAGWTVIDDTYNANPASLYSALQVLAGMQGTPWLVLGDMKELGQGSRKMHREVGEAAKAMGVRRLFTTGEMSAFTAEAFGEGAQHFEHRNDLAKTLLSVLRPDVNCLVKGSRSMGMEAIVDAITRAPVMRETG